MACHPLSLGLAEHLSARTATRHGFRLRLVDGPAVEPNDPLLRAFGVSVTDLFVDPAHEEALQHEAFDPGRRLRLEAAPLDPHDPDAVGVWDLDGVRQAGELPGQVDAVVAAALDHGLPMEAVALREERDRVDDRRCDLTVLVYSPRFVSLEGLDELTYDRARRSGRRRLVLFADGSDDVRWWDPSAGGGPVDVRDVPVSPEVAAGLERLSEDYAALRDQAVVGSGDGYDRFDESFDRMMLEQDARELWRRARTEIGRRYAVGFLGHGMKRPVWSPDELVPDDEDGVDDIRF